MQGRAATGGSFPATIWKKFMEAATVDMNDAFISLPPEQIAVGTVINEGELLEEQATCIVDPRPARSAGPPRPARPPGSHHHDRRGSQHDRSRRHDRAHGPDHHDHAPHHHPRPWQPQRRLGVSRASGRERLVGVLAPAGEAPALDLGDHLDVIACGLVVALACLAGQVPSRGVTYTRCTGSVSAAGAPRVAGGQGVLGRRGRRHGAEARRR